MHLWVCFKISLNFYFPPINLDLVDIYKAPDVNGSVYVHLLVYKHQVTVVKIDEFCDDAGYIMEDRTDPYVVLTLGNQTFKTKVKVNAGGTNVEFNECLSFKKDRTSNTLVVCKNNNLYIRAQRHIHAHATRTHVGESMT